MIKNVLKNCEKLNACKYDNRDNRYISMFLLLPPRRNEFWVENQLLGEGNSKDSLEACDIKQLKCFVS